MIYTVTLNPTLDNTIEVDELVYDDVNNVREVRKRAGGKGIDVSRVINELGGQSIALGFAGGYVGMELEGSLLNEGVSCSLTKIHEETKTNVIIYQQKKNLKTLLSTREPPISPLETAGFFKIIKEIPERSYVVISGNPPEGVNDSFFAQIITTLKGRDVKVFLDTDGEALKKGVGAGPCLIKPNIYEFGRLVEKNIVDIEEILEYSQRYSNIVTYIIVSMGAQGVVGISKHGNYCIVPPKVKVRSSMGAGDSLLAGVVYGMSEGLSFEEALVIGVACGTASTLNQENGLCLKEDVYNIKKDIVVKRI